MGTAQIFGEENASLRQTAYSEKEWLDIFADNLKEIINEQGYTPTEFAKAVGIPKSTMSRYLNKERMPNIRFIINTSYELNVDFMDLIDFGGKIE